MSARAKTKKCQGVVVDGRIRDLAEHRTMQFPVSVKKKKHCHLLPIYTAERFRRI
jgi:regulator of RNase E activity RraA